jgi:hypothetical protein
MQNLPKEKSSLQAVLLFDSLFTEKEIRNEFQKFLQETKENPQLMFVLEFNELESLKERKPITEKIKTIFERFLLSDSNFEIPLLEKEKSFLLDLYESFQLDLEEQNLTETFITGIIKNFHQISSKLKKELCQTSWTKFCQTSICENLKRKFHKICVPKVIKYCRYKDEYFNHPFVFDSDFEFADLLFKDSSHWDLFTNQKNPSKAYISKLNYLPNVSHAKDTETVKYECTIPVSLERLSLSFATNEGRKRAGGMVTHMETLEYYNYENLVQLFHEKGWEKEIGKFERNLTVNCSHIQLPMILNYRVHNLGCSMRYDQEDESLTVVVKPYIRENMNFFESFTTEICPQFGKPMKRMKAYSVFAFSFYKYKKIDTESVSVSQVLIMDLGGWTKNENIAKTVINEKIMTFKNSLMKYVDEFPKDAKIKDYKEILCKEKEGKVVDGLGKLLSELNIQSKKK